MQDYLSILLNEIMHIIIDFVGCEGFSSLSQTCKRINHICQEPLTFKKFFQRFLESYQIPFQEKQDIDWKSFWLKIVRELKPKWSPIMERGISFKSIYTVTTSVSEICEKCGGKIANTELNISYLPTSMQKKLKLSQGIISIKVCNWCREANLELFPLATKTPSTFSSLHGFVKGWSKSDEYSGVSSHFTDLERSIFPKDDLCFVNKNQESTCKLGGWPKYHLKCCEHCKAPKQQLLDLTIPKSSHCYVSYCSNHHFDCVMNWQKPG